MDMCKNLWTYVNPDETIIVRKYERKAYYFRNFIMINVFIIVTVFVITSQISSFSSKSSNETVLKILPFR
jgi:hypothetical protein